MSKVYAVISVAKKHIVEQCENCNLKKNSNGLYNHDDIVKVQETIKGKLNKVFLDHNSGLGMIKLLDSNDNKINTVTTIQMISADSGGPAPDSACGSQTVCVDHVLLHGFVRRVHLDHRILPVP